MISQSAARGRDESYQQDQCRISSGLRPALLRAADRHGELLRDLGIGHRRDGHGAQVDHGRTSSGFRLVSGGEVGAGEALFLEDRKNDGQIHLNDLSAVDIVRVHSTQ